MDSPIDRQRLIVPGMAGVYQRFAPYSYAFMRFITGAILVPHGLQKVFGASIDRFATNIGGKGIPFAEHDPNWHHKSKIAGDVVARLYAALE